MERTVLHIVGGESRSRAEQARIAFALGHHAEVYSELRELLERPPSEGIILAAETGEAGGARRLIDQLGESGIWLPVVVTSTAVDLEQVVSAIRAGALDYLALPLEMNSFAGRLHSIVAEARPYEERRQREVEAARRISHLSGREHQVLGLLSAGLANKEIAQQLRISPRTVEIHRANMMSKLGAGHAADAVKAWLAAGLDRATPAEAETDLRRPRFRVVRAQDEALPEGQAQQRKLR
ncbi:MAG: LuxR C-terminal-related transcriptional regulator [Croceibacterium sp.]